MATKSEYNDSPFNLYKMPNLDCNVTYESGATLKGYAIFYSWYYDIKGDGSVDLIGNNSNSLLKLNSGTISINDNSTSEAYLKEVNFSNASVDINSLSVVNTTEDNKYTSTLYTTEKCYFPISEYLKISINGNSNINVNQKIKLFHDVTINVNDNSKININKDVILFSGTNTQTSDHQIYQNTIYKNGNPATLLMNGNSSISLESGLISGDVKFEGSNNNYESFVQSIKSLSSNFELTCNEGTNKNSTYTIYFTESQTLDIYKGDTLKIRRLKNRYFEYESDKTFLKNINGEVIASKDSNSSSEWTIKTGSEEIKYSAYSNSSDLAETIECNSTKYVFTTNGYINQSNLVRDDVNHTYSTDASTTIYIIVGGVFISVNKYSESNYFYISLNNNKIYLYVGSNWEEVNSIYEDNNVAKVNSSTYALIDGKWESCNKYLESNHIIEKAFKEFFICKDKKILKIKSRQDLVSTTMILSDIKFGRSEDKTKCYVLEDGEDNEKVWNEYKYENCLYTKNDGYKYFYNMSINNSSFWKEYKVSNVQSELPLFLEIEGEAEIYNKNYQQILIHDDYVSFVYYDVEDESYKMTTLSSSNFSEFYIYKENDKYGVLIDNDGSTRFVSGDYLLGTSRNSSNSRYIFDKNKIYKKINTENTSIYEKNSDDKVKISDSGLRITIGECNYFLTLDSYKKPKKDLSEAKHFCDKKHFSCFFNGTTYYYYLDFVNFSISKNFEILSSDYKSLYDEVSSDKLYYGKYSRGKYLFFYGTNENRENVCISKDESEKALESFFINVDNELSEDVCDENGIPTKTITYMKYSIFKFNDQWYIVCFIEGAESEPTSVYIYKTTEKESSNFNAKSFYDEKFSQSKTNP